MHEGYHQNSIEKPRYKIRENCKYGFIDHDGNLAINAIFDFADDEFAEDLCAVKMAGKWGFINRDGDIVIDPRYEKAERFSDGLALVKNGSGEWGFINHFGELVIPFRFYLYPPCGFSESLARVNINGRIGFIDRNGNLTIVPVFDWAANFSGGYAVIRSKAGYGFINKIGHMATGDSYEYAGWFREGFARVAKAGKYGFLNSHCETAIDRRYDWAGNFSAGIAAVGYNGKVLFINPQEEIINGDMIDDEEITQSYGCYGHFGAELWPIFLDRKWGLINRSGNIAIKPFAEKGVGPFIDDAAWFYNGGAGMGFIDMNGDIIIEERFPTLETFGFHAGICGVSDCDGKLAYISKKGEYVWQASF